MIPKIHKILYATDLSPNSKYAMRYALNSAKNHDAEIIILHVLEQVQAAAQFLVSAYLDSERSDIILKENIDHVKTKIERRMKKFCKKELEEEPELIDRIDSLEICEGFPAEEILKKADELDCDIIVMGSHGKGFLGNTFLGKHNQKGLAKGKKTCLYYPSAERENRVDLRLG